MRKTAEQKSEQAKLKAEQTKAQRAQIKPAERIKPKEEQANPKQAQTIAEQGINGCIDEDVAPFVGALFRAIAGVDDRQTVVVCFGTNVISGDSLGPTVGRLLRDKYRVSAFVYGTDEHSVNGKNMGEWLDFIKSVHKGALFIAVDASLGGGDKIGQIIIRPDGVCPAAIKGKTDRFGDVGILGVVAKNAEDPLMQLMQVSPLYVEKMADKIANMLYCAMN